MLNTLPARFLAALFATAFLLPNAACVPMDAIDIGGDVTYNEKLRPDLQPLTAAQQSGPPWVEADGKAYYSDGGPGGEEFVSELYHSMIPPERLRELRRSRCLFVERGGFPMLSFEAIASNVDAGDAHVNIDRAGLCRGYPNHPVTREVAEIDGHPSNFGVKLSVGVGVFAYAGNAVLENPYGACDGALPTEELRFTQGADLPGGGDGTAKPYCLIQGSPGDTPDEDTSYVLDLVDVVTGEPASADHPTYNHSPHTVLPHLKVVNGLRSIARPLDFQGVDYDPERDRYVHSFTWSVDSVDANGSFDPSGAFWRENFAPSVLIESARFFVELGGAPAPEGSPLRDYVLADKLRVAEIGDLGAQETRPFDKGCDLEQAGDPEGDGTLYLSPCEITATPTYALTPDVNGRMTEKLEWRVQFFTTGPGDAIPVDPAELFFIEFRLQAPTFGSQSGSLLVDPGYADAGDAPIGTTQRVQSALQLRSVGAAGVRVDGLRVAGPDAASFAIELPAGIELPFILPAGRSVALDLLVETNRWGDHEAELLVDWSDAGQRQEELRAPLYAHGVAAQLAVLPRVVSLKRGDGAGPNDHVRRVLVTNPGNAPLERGPFGVSGTDAGFFSVIRSECEGKTTSPASSRCVLQPGGMELLTVEYAPLVAGLHDAVLSLQTNAGDDEVVLLGSCNGACTYLPPTSGGGGGGGEDDGPDLDAAIDVGIPGGPQLRPGPGTALWLPPLGEPRKR